MRLVTPLRIPEAAKERLRVMFIAKHARSGGTAHQEDGNHAIYHHEIATVLQGIFRNVQIANRFEDLFEKPDVDFIFSLLNRGGFLNSEMLVPCSRCGTQSLRLERLRSCAALPTTSI
jgi:D-alanine-D-alanine ligase